jgi:Caenorhabditis protein of unknown function, DUF268
MIGDIKTKLKKFAKRFFGAHNKVDTLLGINPNALLALRHFPRYLRDRNEYLSRGGQITHTYPVLIDYTDSAGSTSGHYFHQDLLVASFIANTKPNRHIDIGSRIDGFVAHVASFRTIEVVDVRPLSATGHTNIVFVQADLMNQSNAYPIADSVSCLHAIEHFGLGRYTDPIDPNGYSKGFSNILKMVDTNGMLYISFPIGQRNEIHFNAHRVFHPLDIFKWTGCDTLKLERFDYVDDAGRLHQDLNLNEINLNVKYGCGIYSFRKIK